MAEKHKGQPFALFPSKADRGIAGHLLQQEAGEGEHQGRPESYLFLAELHEKVDRPRDGMIVYADGADWNPGWEEGPYLRILSEWRPLGPSSLP
jgi:hypothetical protein